MAFWRQRQTLTKKDESGCVTLIYYYAHTCIYTVSFPEGLGMRLGCVLKQVLFHRDMQGCGECTHLVVGGVHHDHGEEALGQGLVEELEEAGTVVGLHRIIVFILLHLWGRG